MTFPKNASREAADVILITRKRSIALAVALVTSKRIYNSGRGVLSCHLLIIFEVAYRSNLYIYILVPHNHARKISRNVYSNYLHLLTARKVNHAKSKS